MDKNMHMRLVDKMLEGTFWREYSGGDLSYYSKYEIEQMLKNDEFHHPVIQERWK